VNRTQDRNQNMNDGLPIDDEGNNVTNEVSAIPVQNADAEPVEKSEIPVAVEKNSARNRLRDIRLENMMSKAELARKAGLSVLTVTRIEDGFGCRMDTKRKILKALGLKVADRRKVFEDD